MMQKRLIIVTGSTGTIGRDITRHLILKNYNLALCSRNTHDLLMSQVLELRQTGMCAEAFPLDVTDPDAVRKTFNKIRNSMGVPFGLVHCIGPFYQHVPFFPSKDTWDAQFIENTTSSAHVVECAVSTMADSGRRRIIIMGFSGINSGQGFQQIIPYAASKEALMVFVRSVAKKFALSGLTINMISPGIFPDTPRVEPTQVEKTLLKRIPLGRYGDILTVSKCVEWLLSERSDYVTGQNIKISGGLHISKVIF